MKQEEQNDLKLNNQKAIQDRAVQEQIDDMDLKRQGWLDVAEYKQEGKNKSRESIINRNNYYFDHVKSKL